MTDGKAKRSPGQDSSPIRLRPHEVAQIEDALRRVGGEGEVCLVVQSGRLRFIEIQRCPVAASAVAGSG